MLAVGHGHLQRFITIAYVFFLEKRECVRAERFLPIRVFPFVDRKTPKLRERGKEVNIVATQRRQRDAQASTCRSNGRPTTNPSRRNNADPITQSRASSSP